MVDDDSNDKDAVFTFTGPTGIHHRIPTSMIGSLSTKKNREKLRELIEESVREASRKQLRRSNPHNFGKTGKDSVAVKTSKTSKATMGATAAEVTILTDDADYTLGNAEVTEHIIEGLGPAGLDVGETYDIVIDAEFESRGAHCTDATATDGEFRYTFTR